MTDIKRDGPAQGRDTIAVWGGEREHEPYERATQVPVVHSVSFGYRDLDTWSAVALGREEGHIYSRNTNPTVRAFEEKVRDLEAAEAATSFATGMAAIGTTFFTFLRPGDRVVSIKDSYGGTNKLFTEFLPAFGIEATLCATGDHAAIEAEIARGCKLLYLESPTNPTVKITDIARLAAAAHRVGALVAVHILRHADQPESVEPRSGPGAAQRHQIFGGHADALGGAACGRRELVQRMYHFREINGATLGGGCLQPVARHGRPWGCASPGRMRAPWRSRSGCRDTRRSNRSTTRGLATHPNHDIAARQMRGFGGMLSFSVRGGLDAIKVFLPGSSSSRTAQRISGASRPWSGRRR